MDAVVGVVTAFKPRRPEGGARYLSIGLVALVLLLCGQRSIADVIYSADFNTGMITNVATLGWNAYQNNGTDLSNSTADPLRVLTDGRVTIGSSSVNQGGAFALIANVNLDPTQYEAGLAISYTFGGNNRLVEDPMGFRTLVQVGGTWYATDITLLGAGAVTVARVVSNVVSQSIWRSWEANVTDGFDFSSGFGALQALPGGDISNFGLLAVDGVTPTDNDSLNLNNTYQITGTVVPEPATFSLLAAGLLATGCAGWRRRRHVSGT